MSAGVFERTFYGLDTGNGGGTARARVQPETLAATINAVANAAPAGPATIPVTASASGGIRENGIRMRNVTLQWTAAPPDGYSGDDVTIPVMQEATFAAWTLGQTGTYLGAAVEVVGRSPERVR